MTKWLAVLPWWIWPLLCVAAIGGKALYDHRQREIGRTQCEANYTAEKARADKLQSELDAKAREQTAPILARYNVLNEALATYDRSPVSVAGCGIVPDDIVRAVNAAHARK